MRRFCAVTVPGLIVWAAFASATGVLVILAVVVWAVIAKPEPRPERGRRMGPVR